MQSWARTVDRNRLTHFIVACGCKKKKAQFVGQSTVCFVVATARTSELHDRDRSCFISSTEPRKRLEHFLFKYFLPNIVVLHIRLK